MVFPDIRSQPLRTPKVGFSLPTQAVREAHFTELLPLHQVILSVKWPNCNCFLRHFPVFVLVRYTLSAITKHEYELSGPCVMRASSPMATD